MRHVHGSARASLPTMTGPEHALAQPGCVFPEPDDAQTRAWFGVIKQLAGRSGTHAVGAVSRATVGRNYDSVLLAPRSGGPPTTILLNPAVRLTACSSGDWTDLGWVSIFEPYPHPDPAEAKQAFHDAGLTLVDPDVLDRPIDELDTSGLTPYERREIAQWGLSRLGQVLFNNLD